MATIANENNLYGITQLLAQDEEAPIVEFVNQILNAAVLEKASDIHFEPYEQDYRIRYRLDGFLMEIVKPPFQLASRINARIKVMANLDIAERRKPQDGRIQFQNVDFRVSTCPTINGEKIVIRIFDTKINQLDLNTLGLTTIQQEQFLQCLNKSQGLILATGPTGSGKTLTLYTALSLLNSKEANISTAEDPVEIKIPGINQVAINPQIDLNFSTILRAFLRQDPDIIMVGEIRDGETAELAIKAAQTGHLVLSTLHTNSAAESLIRLSNLGIEAFNLASSLSLLIAQRLARRLCDFCKKPEAENSTLYKAHGCSKCNNGYSGRIGLFEFMPISKTISELIYQGANAVELLNQAKAEGMISIYQSGLEKIKQGLTTFEELNSLSVD